ncbi:DUF1415 domain-containing protein [bacterium]|nr:MAG: DUF1415 domain-containing protein [bacterium]
MKKRPVSTPPSDKTVIAATRKWLKDVVIGLNLCPFAREVYVAERIRYVVSPATDVEALRAQLAEELRLLPTLDPAATETTLLIHPGVLGDFLDYNDFLDLAEGALAELGLEGVLQIASFHPQYRFADAEPDDPANGTNRSPYPMLHLLREASVAKAVAGYPDADKIPERNIATLRRLAALETRSPSR